MTAERQTYSQGNSIRTATEREKQLSGMAYDGADAELKAMQYHAQELVKELNAVPMDREQERAAILEKLLGRAGKHLRVYPPMRVDFGCNVFTGDDVFINQNCTFLDNNTITIGERVLIGPDVKLYCAVHPIEGAQRYYETQSGKAHIVSSSKPITIGNDVWIGGGAILLAGVRIGNNVVIGAGSVVTKDVPDNVVAAGNPARIIKYLKGEKENG